MSAENEAAEVRRKAADYFGGVLSNFQALVRKAHQEGYEKGYKEANAKIARDLGWTNPHKS